ELRGVQGGEELGGRHAPRGVEAHVERAARPDAEAPGGISELEARQAEVEQEAVDGGEARVGGDRPELAEVRLAEHEPIAEAGSEATVHSGGGRPIGVEAEEAAIRVGRLQDPLGVPTAVE